MINFNGKSISDTDLVLNVQNRAFRYGDCVYESMRYINGKIMFFEDHYFRLMGAMRLVRMEIPMNFTPDFLEEQILELIVQNNLEEKSARIRFGVYREGGGLYAPTTNDVGYYIEAKEINDNYELNKQGLVVDIYKDHYKQKGLLSNIKCGNSLLYTVASIYKTENEFDECFLINDEKHLVEAISCNVFLVKGKEIITPALTEGCVKGVMRKQIIKIAEQEGYTVKETSVSPFELQKVDEVFLTNASRGIQWVEKYRKKQYTNTVSQKLMNVLIEQTN